MKKYFQGVRETVAVLFIAVFLIGVAFLMHLITPVSIHEKWKEVKIPEGVTYSQGIDILRKEGMIHNRFVFLILGKVTKLERKLRAGFYNLNTSMTPLEIFSRLRKGMVLEYQVTIPEGADLDDIRVALKMHRLIDDDSWKLVSDSDFLASLNVRAPSLEGYIFPETYNFAKGAEPKNIFSIMVQKMREKFDDSMKKRAQELGLSENDILTIASIVEKEAAVDRERHLVSAVLHNRLRKKMRLQMDPTVVYGIKKISLGITKEDLKRYTPYNTYVITGLPPGPIASPGIKSIIAALYPAKTDYLYFVAKNDRTHYFSSSNREHEKAVMIYQRQNRQETSPAQNEKGTEP